jgi:hypothetical protein
VHSMPVEKNTGDLQGADGCQLQCKALKGRGKTGRRKNNGKQAQEQGQKAMETMKNAAVMQP